MGWLAGIGVGLKERATNARMVVEGMEILEGEADRGFGEVVAEVAVKMPEDVVTGAARGTEDVRGNAEEDPLRLVGEVVGGREEEVKVACPGVSGGGKEAVGVSKGIGEKVGAKGVGSVDKVCDMVAVPLL
jgi:hypothetical protein